MRLSAVNTYLYLKVLDLTCLLSPPLIIFRNYSILYSFLPCMFPGAPKPVLLEQILQRYCNPSISRIKHVIVTFPSHPQHHLSPRCSLKHRSCTTSYPSLPPLHSMKTCNQLHLSQIPHQHILSSLPLKSVQKSTSFYHLHCHCLVKATQVTAAASNQSPASLF